MRSSSSRSLHQEQPAAQQGQFWMGPLQQQQQPPAANFMVNPWSGQPFMMGQPMGQPAMRRSMHELGTIPAPAMPMAAFFAPPPPPPPPQQRTSSPSAASQTSEWSRVSEVARQPQPEAQKLVKGGNARKKRQKREKRFNKSSSRPQSRSHSRNSQKDWNEGNYPRSEESDKRDSEEGRGKEQEEDIIEASAAVAAKPFAADMDADVLCRSDLDSSILYELLPFLTTQLLCMEIQTS